jgi:hypothetical protein
MMRGETDSTQTLEDAIALRVLAVIRSHAPGEEWPREIFDGMTADGNAFLQEGVERELSKLREAWHQAGISTGTGGMTLNRTLAELRLGQKIVTSTMAAFPAVHRFQAFWTYFRSRVLKPDVRWRTLTPP